MAKNDNLKDFLTDVADAIREKKGSTDLINPQDFSSEIASIQSGGDIWGFDEIGYTPENSPIDDWVKYSKKKAEQYTTSNALTIFKGDTNLAFAPMVDTIPLKSVAAMYQGCSILQWLDMDIPTATNCSSLASNCQSLVSLKLRNSGKVTNYERMCDSCANLREVEADFSSATNVRYVFRLCPLLSYFSADFSSAIQAYGTFSSSGLIEIRLTNTNNIEQYGEWGTNKNWKILDSIDLSSATLFSSMFRNSPLLVYIKVTNLGKSSLTSYDFSSATNWGVATTEIPDARQSLIDSLIMYSYDRASNGMETATIKLSATTKALLTEEEIAQITNKGFTIS